MLKFHDDPTVNESEIVIFLRHVRWLTGKERALGEKRKKRKCEAEEGGRGVRLKTESCCYL